MGKKFKMIEYKYDDKTKRTKIVLAEGVFVKTETVYVDTGYTFKSNNEQVFCTFPEMTEINNRSDEHNFLNGCLRRIRFEETGEINFSK